MNMEQVVKKLWVGEVGRHANFSSMMELAWEQESYQGKKEMVFLGIKDDQKTLWLVQKTQKPTSGEDRGSQGHCHEDSCSPCSEICTGHIVLVDSRKLAAVGIYQTSIWLQTFSAATSLISNIFWSDPTWQSQHCVRIHLLKGLSCADWQPCPGKCCQAPGKAS